MNQTILAACIIFELIMQTNQSPLRDRGEGIRNQLNLTSLHGNAKNVSLLQKDA